MKQGAKIQKHLRTLELPDPHIMQEFNVVDLGEKGVNRSKKVINYFKELLQEDSTAIYYINGRQQKLDFKDLKILILEFDEPGSIEPYWLDKFMEYLNSTFKPPINFSYIDYKHKQYGQIDNMIVYIDYFYLLELEDRDYLIHYGWTD